MKKIAKIIVLCLLLMCGCQADLQQSPGDIPAEPEVKKTPMFTDVEKADARIEEITCKTFDMAIMNAEWLAEFTTLAAQGEEMLLNQTASPDERCEMAEKLTVLYNSAEYLRGDTPRVYITTNVTVLNYAKGCAVTTGESSELSDSLESSQNGAELAVDGDSGTYWQADEAENCLTLDFGRICEIGYVSVEWGKGAAKHYEIDVSADEAEWKTVRVIEDGAKYKTQGFTLDTAECARYLRIRTITSSSLPYQLEEITVSKTKPVRNSLSMEYSEAEIAIVDREGGRYPTIAEKVRIKIRGNSTANTVKNPYNIKFDKKKTILGMKGTKKWCLIANLFDKSLLRNKLASDFAAEAGVNPELKSTFVDVYFDGNYSGCYLLIMPVTDGTVGIDVGKGEMLLERNGYYNKDAAGVNYNYTPITGMRFVPIAPEKGMETDEQKKAIKNLLKEAEYAAVSGERKRVESIFDVESFVNMYICEELMKDIDIFHGSTYFYYKNERLYSGPIWDMDLSMGNVSMAEGVIDEKYAKYHNMLVGDKKIGNGTRNDSTTGNWATVDFYAPLMENMWFRDLVRERYAELIPAIENLYKDGGVIDGYVEEFGEAFLRNYELGRYRLDVKYFQCEYDHPTGNYSDSVEYLKNWLRERDNWLRKNLKVE